MNKNGQYPSYMRVLEGGREHAPEKMIPGSLRQKVGAFVAIMAIGVGMNSMLDSSMPENKGQLTCSGHQEIPTGYPSQSEAVVQNISGINNADEMTRIPVTLSDGETVQYGDLLPTGAPSDAIIPTSC